MCQSHRGTFGFSCRTVCLTSAVCLSVQVQMQVQMQPQWQAQDPCKEDGKVRNAAALERLKGCRVVCFVWGFFYYYFYVFFPARAWFRLSTAVLKNRNGQGGFKQMSHGL